MSVSLATIADLEVVLGSEIADGADTDRAERLIEMASATVEDWCGRAFTKVTDDVISVKVGRNGLLRLPNGPVASVGSVVSVDGDTVDADAYTLRGDIIYRTCGSWWPGLWTVTYTHGYDPIPDSVIKAVCKLVALDMSGASIGYQSESLGDWSGTVRANAEQEILASLRGYRRLAGRIEVLT